MEITGFRICTYLSSFDLPVAQSDAKQQPGRDRKPRKPELGVYDWRQACQFPPANIGYVGVGAAIMPSIYHRYCQEFPVILKCSRYCNKVRFIVWHPDQVLAVECGSSLPICATRN